MAHRAVERVELTFFVLIRFTKKHTTNEVKRMFESLNRNRQEDRLTRTWQKELCRCRLSGDFSCFFVLNNSKQRMTRTTTKQSVLTATRNGNRGVYKAVRRFYRVTTFINLVECVYTKEQLVRPLQKE